MELDALLAKLVDLLPVVRHNVYQPDFRRVLALFNEWARLHREELFLNWRRLHAGLLRVRIPPLE